VGLGPGPSGVPGAPIAAWGTDVRQNGAVTSPHLTHDPTAVVGRRLGAYLIDMVLIMGILPVALFFVTAGLVEYTQGPSCGELEAIGRSGGSVMCVENVLTFNSADDTSSTVTFERNAVLIAGGASLAYLVIVMWIVQGLTGSTAGKVITGIRTVDEQGDPPGIGRQLIRGLLWVIPDGIILCFLPLVAIFTICLSNGHRRVGDMAAHTYVVAATAAGRPVVVAGAAVHPPTHEAGYAPTPAYAGGGDPPTLTGIPTFDAPTVGATPGWAEQRGSATGAGAAAAGGYAAGARSASYERPADSGGRLDLTGGQTSGGPAATAATAGAAGTAAGAADASTAAAAGTAAGGAEGAYQEESAAASSADAGASGAEQASSEAGPRWDEARNAYIFWDASRHAWLVHDATTGEWSPIE
jgi:uncharacterized RDD family membrane protein YckC